MSANALAQITAIPDADFEQALIDLGIDGTGILDGSVFTNDINTITTLNVNNKGISDLSGIEGFAALQTLLCNTNDLTSLDLSQNTALETVFCSANFITSINVSNSPALQVLNCENNQIAALDVSGNTALVNLFCGANNLSGLDVSNNTALQNLECYDNTIATLDISNNTQLTLLDVSYTSLNALNLSNNTALTSLTCNNSQFGALDVSGNVALESLDCRLNQITELDVSANTAMTLLHANNNLLTSLNVRNGNNSQMNNVSFNASGNPDLECITVDDVNYANATWFQIDAQTAFSENCNLTYVPDDNFEQALIDLGYDDVLDDQVATTEISGVVALNVNNRNISDMTGIADFAALADLRCRDNVIENLDLSQNVNLSSLRCYNNQLVSLNVRNGNNLNMTAFNATGNSDLLCIEVDDATYSTANWVNVDAQSSFSEDCSVGMTYVPDNNFEQALIDLGLDDVLNDQVITANINTVASLVISNKGIADLTGIEDFTALVNLNCLGNQLTTLDLSQNTSLTNLNVGTNQISVLDVTQNTALVVLWCDNNQLVELNVANGNNSQFTVFNATGNTDLTCIQVDDAAYSTANWVNVDSQSAFSENCALVEQTYVPDDNFEQALIGLGYDVGPLNDSVPTANIDTALSINISSQGISDLTGIEDFADLTELFCDYNSISSVDVSQNLALDILSLSGNNLTQLDVTQNTVLTSLNCSNNELTELDVSLNTSLVMLNFKVNSISGIDLSQNTQLTNLFCFTNQLTTLDLTQNTALTNLRCQNNGLQNLDVAQNTVLRMLNCSGNELTALNVKNTNNDNFIVFDATDNPDLICIEVDNETYSTTNWTDIDAQSFFSENCNLVSVNTPDAASGITLYPNPAKDVFAINTDLSVHSISILDATGRAVLHSSKQKQMDVSGLPSGIYFVLSATDKGMYRHRLVVQ